MKPYLLLLLLPELCVAASLPCAGWPTNMAEVYLQNAGLVKIQDLDESRTQATPIAIQKIGKDLYRQVFDIHFYAKLGENLHVITVNNASSQECSMSGVDVYLVSRKLSADEP